MSQVVVFDRSDAFAHVPNPWEVSLHPDCAAAWTVNVTPGSSTASVLAQLPIDNTTKIKNDGGDDGNDESSIAEKRSGSADDENPMF